MRVLIAALCDYASVAQPGHKLNVMGAFDVIAAPRFPALHLVASLALRLQFEYEDSSSTHRLEVVIINQDGREFARIQGNIETPEIPPGERITANQIFVLEQLLLPGPDRFSTLILGDEEERQRLALDVVAVAPPTLMFDVRAGLAILVGAVRWLRSRPGPATTPAELEVAADVQLVPG